MLTIQIEGLFVKYILCLRYSLWVKMTILKSFVVFSHKNEPMQKVKKSQAAHHKSVGLLLKCTLCLGCYLGAKMTILKSFVVFGHQKGPYKNDEGLSCSLSKLRKSLYITFCAEYAPWGSKHRLKIFVAFGHQK